VVVYIINKYNTVLNLCSAISHRYRDTAIVRRVYRERGVILVFRDNILYIILCLTYICDDWHNTSFSTNFKYEFRGERAGVVPSQLLVYRCPSSSGCTSCSCNAAVLITYGFRHRGTGSELTSVARRYRRRRDIILCSFPVRKLINTCTGLVPVGHNANTRYTV